MRPGTLAATSQFAGLDTLTIQGRHLSLKRVLNNLVGNALKYGNSIRVEARIVAGMAELLVLDDGPGLPDEKLDSVFDPFVRIETSRSKETGGVGLGLTIARSIARAHRGDVALSNRRGGGLAARLTLPIAVMPMTQPPLKLAAKIADSQPVLGQSVD